MSEERVEYIVNSEDQHQKYVDLVIREQYLKLHYRNAELMKKISRAIPTYLYMVDNITRGRSKWPWWNDNVYPFYVKGYLPFAKHQSFIATDIDCTQKKISQDLSLLEDNGIIKQIANLRFNSDKRYMRVYSLGTWSLNSKGREEVYYLYSTGLE